MKIFFPFLMLGIGTLCLSATQNDDGRLIIVPVVFHVLYTDSLPDNGISDAVRNSHDGNSTSRLPKEKILAELQDLDQDFQRTNPDIGDVIPEYKNVIGNPNIHFVLKDILYVKTDQAQINESTNTEAFRRISPMQDPQTCLNVYISRLKVEGGGSEGVTNVPGDQVYFAQDGVNLNFCWVGLHYRLLSHEVGHWLGLFHTFDNQQLTVGMITDIPVQTKKTDIECVLCTKKGIKVIHRQRSQFQNPNTNNYMDYSGCRRMFSFQQCTYMRNSVATLRKQLWENSQPAH